MPLITLHPGSHPSEFDAPPGCSKGLRPRDFLAVPLGSKPMAPAYPKELELMESEIQPRLDALLQAQVTLYDLRLRGNAGGMIPSRDQDGIGWCWCHSGVSAALLERCKQGEPYVDLSAFAIGSIIKNYRDEGGNGIEGVEFQAERGCPTSQFWPQQSRSKANDNPQTWANAALHKMQLWYDLDPSRMWLQLCSAMAMDLGPAVSDFNWWSHSVCTARIKDYKGKVSTIWNSWGDSWSDQGMGDLQGSHAVPDNAQVLRIEAPSLAM